MIANTLCWTIGERVEPAKVKPKENYRSGVGKAYDNVFNDNVFNDNRVTVFSSIEEMLGAVVEGDSDQKFSGSSFLKSNHANTDNVLSSESSSTLLSSSPSSLGNWGFGCYFFSFGIGLFGAGMAGVCIALCAETREFKLLGRAIMARRKAKLTKERAAASPNSNYSNAEVNAEVNVAVNAAGPLTDSDSPAVNVAVNAALTPVRIGPHLLHLSQMEIQQRLHTADNTNFEATLTGWILLSYALVTGILVPLMTPSTYGIPETSWWYCGFMPWFGLVVAMVGFYPLLKVGLGKEPVGHAAVHSRHTGGPGPGDSDRRRGSAVEAAVEDVDGQTHAAAEES
jgi:hypothetical protein